MTGAYTPLLAALIALLVGLTVGKAWERYKLRDGRWFDRRKARDTPHYMLGLNFLVSNQPDLAIEELTKAATVDSDALEIDLILGNLYREKGQVGRAIQVHQTLLQRPKLKRLEHAYALFASGWTTRAADSWIGRSRRSTRCSGSTRTTSTRCSTWRSCTRSSTSGRTRTTSASGGRGRPAGRATRAPARPWRSSRTNSACRRCAQGDRAAAAARFTAAIDLDARAVPAYLHLGDVQLQLGRTAEAMATWERAVAVARDRAYLAFDRLESAYAALGNPGRFPALCRRLIAAAPKDWRSRVALAQHLTEHGQATEALGLLFEALSHHPHGLAVHRAVWQTLRQLGLDPALVERYVDLAGKAVFYLDPHVCTHCRYRSTELLWHCPHCHEWNSFVEERMAAAKDGDEADS